MSKMPLSFLKNVARRVPSERGKLWRVESLSRRPSYNFFDGVPPWFFVYDSMLGRQLWLERHQCGAHKARLIGQICHDMLRAVWPHIEAPDGQVLILNGGRPLDLNLARPPLLTHELPTGAVKLERVSDSSMIYDFRVERLDHPDQAEIPAASVLFVGEECQASGETLATFLKQYLVGLKSRHEPLPHSIIIAPVIASMLALSRVGSICAEYEVRLVYVANCGLAHVHHKGVALKYTDLGLGEYMLVSRELHAQLVKRYQDRDICFVGDIGQGNVDSECHYYLYEVLRDMVHFNWDFEREFTHYPWPAYAYRPEFHRFLQSQAPYIWQRVRPFLDS